MGEARGRAAFGLVMAIMAVAIGALAGRMAGSGPPSSTMSVAQQEPATVSDETVRVHVSGMVVAPGVVDVPPDAIVADAIGAAGGVSPGAQIDQINLAAPISPGDQIVVPGPEVASAGESGETGDGLLSLARASADELEALPGVGPVLAERIVAFREENGGFEVVEDLLQVSGIGESKLDAIQDLVRP